MDFNYFKKIRYDKPEDLAGIEPYDCYTSAYVDSERVKVPASIIPCKEHWWVCDDSNGLATIEAKHGIRTFSMAEDSDGGISATLLAVGHRRICVDITGFAIPEMLVIFRFLSLRGYKNIDFLYTEPNQYKQNENTQFTEGFSAVKQVYGYRGTHNSNMDRDYLIIAAGYDHSCIIQVANSKKSAKKVMMFGFPPSSPGMFQENILRAHKAEPAVGEECFKNLDLNIYAPANDPFSTAQALKEYMSQLRSKHPTNVYFAPLSSKPQALGIALFYLWEIKDNPMIEWSVIYPYCSRYMHNTTSGIARIWRYEVELP